MAYDHRGHGESDWSPDGEYNIDVFAKDQLQIAQNMTSPPIVIGASLGGLSAMLTQGEVSPGAYSGVILVDITPQMNQQGALEIMKFMADHLKEGFATLEDAAEAVAVYTKRDRQANPEGLRKNLRWCEEDQRYRWHWDPDFLKMRTDPGGGPKRLLKATQAIEVPLLLVRGRQSDLVTEPVAKEFLELVPQAEYVDVEHARHMVAGDRNDIFNEAILEFLNKHR